MAGDYTRVHRLLKILNLVQGARGKTARELSQECEVTERTLYRDLKMLVAAGIPVFFDEEARLYRVPREYHMPPVQLTFEESLALVGMAGQLAKAEQIPFIRPVSQAIDKVRGQLPPKLIDDLARMDDRVSISLAASSDGEEYRDVYERVCQAIRKRRAMLCSYESLNKDPRSEEEFEFRPYSLFYAQRAWYVVGLHGGHKQVRTLKLARFSGAKITGKPYAIPEDFSLRKHLGNAWRMIRGKTSYEVEIDFDGEFAENIADTLWHPTQTITWNEGGGITFRCKVDGLEEIVWWVLSMGPHAVVKRPVELAEQVRKLATTTAAAYAEKVSA
jgi:predicted DNA-binding transcriptional regulator YafY